MVESIVVVGAGRSSSELVGRLSRLAPVVLVDASSRALDSSVAALDAAVEPGAGRHATRVHVGDATSRLVLEDLRGDVRAPVALVVATGDDRAALEICRLGTELKYGPLVAIVNDAETAAECEKLGARPFVKADLVGQVVEQTIRQGGVGAGAGLGFRGGELAEFRVLPSSPAIGVPLTRLRADRWRVAAIYRGDELVLPTGTTVIQAEDRLLVVGEPSILPHVTETLRVGLPTFPLLHGPNVVVYLPSGRDASVEDEAEVLWRGTRADRLVRLYPGAVAATESMVGAPPARQAGAGRGRAQADAPARKTREDAPLEGASLAEHLASARARHPGVIVARPPARTLGDIAFGRGGAASTLCNDAGVPVLFPRGSVSAGRVVLCVTEASGDFGSGDVALDLARMFAVPFAVMRVRLPRYLGGAEDRVAKLVDTVVHRASLHGVAVELVELEGNPIREWLRSTRVDDLCVIGRSATSRDSYAAPDVPLRLARASKCSVLVCTGGSQ
jgi:Trk K+ transport system NAD-binding subunit